MAKEDYQVHRLTLTVGVSRTGGISRVKRGDAI